MGQHDAHRDADSAINTVPRQVVDLVGPDRTVGVLGGDAEALADSLVENGCKVSVLAEHGLADSEGGAGSFDVVVLADALTATAEVAMLVSNAAALLAPAGRLVIAVPNLAHGSRRLALLQGRGPGAAAGGAFTRTDLLAVLSEAGLAVDELRATVADALDGADVDAGRIPAAVVEWVRHQPDALDSAYVALCRPLAPGEEPPSPEVSRAVPVAAVRVEDDHTERMRREQDERHRMLLLRDHIVGLEASLASAGIRQVKAERRANRAEARLVKAKQRINRADKRTKAAELRARRASLARRAALEELEALKQSRTWRVGRMFAKPFGSRRAGG